MISVRKSNAKTVEWMNKTSEIQSYCAATIPWKCFENRLKRWPVPQNYAAKNVHLASNQ